MKEHLIRYAILLLSMGSTPSCNQPATVRDLNNQTGNSVHVSLQMITNQVQSPVAFGVPGDGSGRLFICQKEGKVWMIKNGTLVTRPFLDVSTQLVPVNRGYDERGLLGIAFHPNFKSTHTFYVYYSVPSNASGSDHKGMLAEYRISANDPDVADPSTKRVLLEVEEPESNHNGGNIVFGPDGYLYIGLGDGGGGGDRHGSFGNGQNMATLLGKILRIDVNGQPYKIPADNPFVNRNNIRPEIWAYGLRNPWRFSFDRVTKQLFAGDVGQNKYEEVDIITKGGNYGWRVKEGFHDYDAQNSAPRTALTDPVYEYDHGQGISITGGYIYRGKAIPELYGKYIYGDYNGQVWILTQTGGKWVNSILAVTNRPEENMQLLSWGEDEAGELYALVNFSVSGKGGVYKLVR